MDANTRTLALRDIDVALLRAFVAVAESGSMTAAAHRLHVTQGAVSQRIKRLEDLFEKQLFNRAGGGLATTLDGQRLLRPAQKLIALNDEVFSTMTAPAFTGVVRLGVPYDIVFPFIGPILRSFSTAFPKVNVELELTTSQSLKKALADGLVDLTLTTENHTPEGAELLVSNALVWVGGINGVAHKRDPAPVITFHESCMFRGPMLKALDNAGINWSHMATRNMDATVAMLSADLGITALLESTVPSTVNIIGADENMPPLPDFCINLYTSASGANKAADELALHIRDQFALWRTPAVVLGSDY